MLKRQTTETGFSSLSPPPSPPQAASLTCAQPGTRGLGGRGGAWWRPQMCTGSVTGGWLLGGCWLRAPPFQAPKCPSTCVMGHVLLRSVFQEARPGHRQGHVC